MSTPQPITPTQAPTPDQLGPFHLAVFEDVIKKRMTKEDVNHHLAALDAKLGLVRDRVIGVVNGWSTGFYLWGDGGTSKTWSVEQTLRKINKPYKLTNSRLTGKGLFELLRDFPDMIHVLDDLETMLSDKNSHGVLRAALWGVQDRHGRMERSVNWTIGGKAQEFVFTGGIIIVSNMPLSNYKTLEAMGTRIAVLQHQPSFEEMVALMRKMADQGYTFKGYTIDAEACHEIVDEIEYLCESLKKPIDIRLFVNGRMDRLQFLAGMAETHWLEMLESRIKQRMVRRRDVDKSLNTLTGAPKQGTP